MQPHKFQPTIVNNFYNDFSLIAMKANALRTLSHHTWITKVRHILFKLQVL